MKKRILIISPNPTHPPYSGNSKCILSYTEMLIEEGYDVFLLWVADVTSTPVEKSLTQKFWKNKLIIFRLNQFHRLLRAFYRITHFHAQGSYKVDDFYPYGIKGTIKQAIQDHNFDTIIINYIFFSKIFNFTGNAKKILYTHDVFTNRFQQTGNSWFSVTAQEEAKALNRADSILAIQENEAVFYRYLTTRRVVSAFTYFPVVETKLTGNKTLLFMAGKNQHNLEAITFFIEEVFKELVSRHPDIKLVIGGSICNLIRNNLNNSSISIYGEVNNLADFYEKGDIFINPTFTGTGLKIKTFEAMAHGKVVITHPHNTIGIFCKGKAPIIIAKNNNDYTEAIIHLMINKRKLIKLKKESIKYINNLNESVKTSFIQAIES